MTQTLLYSPHMDIVLDFFDFKNGRYFCHFCPHKSYIRKGVKPHFLRVHQNIVYKLLSNHTKHI